MEIYPTQYQREDGLEIIKQINGTWCLRDIVKYTAFFNFQTKKWVYASTIDFSSFAQFETDYQTAHSTLQEIEKPNLQTMGPKVRF